MKNKNFRKLKYVSGNPQNAGFCTIYPTASGGAGLGGPQTLAKMFKHHFARRSPPTFSKYPHIFESVESPDHIAKQSHMTNPGRFAPETFITYHRVKQSPMTTVITYYTVKQSPMTTFITYHTVKQSSMTTLITYHIIKQSPMTTVITYHIIKQSHMTS